MNDWRDVGSVVRAVARLAIDRARAVALLSAAKGGDELPREEFNSPSPARMALEAAPRNCNGKEPDGEPPGKLGRLGVKTFPPAQDRVSCTSRHRGPASPTDKGLAPVPAGPLCLFVSSGHHASAR